MAFQGSLDTVGLADVFQLFAFAKKSGALHLENDAERAVVYFAGGDVYFATLNPTDDIGNVLVRAGLLGADQWRRVASTAREDVSQGEALLGLPDVDPDALEAFFREWVEDAVFTLMRWREGEYRLEADEHTLGPVFLFGVDPVLEGAQARLEQWESIESAIPSTSMGVVMVGDMPGTAPEVTLRRDEWRLLARLTPGASVSQLATALGETEFRTCQTLHGLLSTQLVELVPAERLAMMRSLVAAQPGESAGAPPVGEAETVAPAGGGPASSGPPGPFRDGRADVPAAAAPAPQAPPPPVPAGHPAPPREAPPRQAPAPPREAPPRQAPAPPPDLPQRPLSPPGYTPALDPARAPAFPVGEPAPAQGTTTHVDPPPPVREPVPAPPPGPPPPPPASLADLVAAAEATSPAHPAGPGGAAPPPADARPLQEAPAPPAPRDAAPAPSGESPPGESSELNKSTILRLIAGVRNL